MKNLLIVVSALLLASAYMYGNCTINITIKIDKGHSQDMPDNIEIYTIEKPFPMLFSEPKFINKIKRIATNKFSFQILNSDTIVYIHVLPFSRTIGILLKNENKINFTITIGYDVIKTNLKNKEFFNFQGTIFLTDDNIVYKIREDSLDKELAKCLIDSIASLRIKKLDSMLDENANPNLYNYFKKKIEMQTVSSLIYDYMIKYDDTTMNNYVMDYIQKQNRPEIVFYFDFYLLSYYYLNYLENIYKNSKKTDSLIINYLNSHFTGIPHDIIFSKYFEEIFYFGGRNNEKLIQKLLNLITNPTIKNNLLNLYNRFRQITLNKAPSFTLPDSHGNLFSLDSILGNVIYLDFWGTWCPPCIKELPALEKLKSELKDYDIKFISIACEHFRKDKWLQAIKKYKLTDIQLYAEQGDYNVTVVKDYLTTYYPRFLIIDKAGKIINTDAPRPSDPKIKDILIKLSKHQKSKR